MGPREEGGGSPQESATSPSSGRVGWLQRCELGPRTVHPGKTRCPHDLGHCTVAQAPSASATTSGHCCHVIEKIKAETRAEFELTRLDEGRKGTQGRTQGGPWVFRAPAAGPRPRGTQSHLSAGLERPLGCLPAPCPSAKPAPCPSWKGPLRQEKKTLLLGRDPTRAQGLSPEWHQRHLEGLRKRGSRVTPECLVPGPGGGVAGGGAPRTWIFSTMSSRRR